jgi:hypothetical protein
MYGDRRKGFALDEWVAIPPGEEMRLNFGDSDRLDRVYGFIELRVRADLTDVNERRLLGVDERFTDADLPDAPADKRIWYHSNRRGSFVP